MVAIVLMTGHHAYLPYCANKQSGRILFHIVHYATPHTMH